MTTRDPVRVTVIALDLAAREDGATTDEVMAVTGLCRGAALNLMRKLVALDRVRELKGKPLRWKAVVKADV